MTATNVCARPGCDNPAARTYCSRACANKDKGRVRDRKGKEQKLLDNIQVISGGPPTELERRLVAAMGYDRAQPVLQEMQLQATDTEIRLSSQPLPHYLATTQPLLTNLGTGGMAALPRPALKPITSTEIEPHTDLYRRTSSYLAEVRRNDEIPYEDVERMQRSAPCVLAARMKKAPLVAALSGTRKWTIKSSDRKLAAVATANARYVLSRFIQDMLQAMDYGVAYGAMSWARETAEKIGVEEKGVGKQAEWNIVDKIYWAHPTTVRAILRDNEYRFIGYEHRRKFKTPPYKIIVPGQALVLTYNGRYGNLYGTSMYDPVYDDWFWYEYILRDFLRYLQRMATPVAVCYAPRGHSTRPDGTSIDNMEYALLIAGYAAEHTALALPSEVDAMTGKPLWRLEYLPADQKGEQFIAALRYFSTQIMRGVIVGDRAATQEEVGSYAAAEIHDKSTQVDNDMVFKDFLGQLNSYWIKRYGQYNVDYNNPPLLRLEAEVLDPLEREILMKLFATAGNVKIGDGSPLDRIDWEEALRGIYAPVLSDEEMEKERQKRLDDSVEAQEKRLKVMAKAQAKQPGQQPGQKTEQPLGQSRTEPGENLKARLAIMEHLADGGLGPVVMTLEDVVALTQSNRGDTDIALRLDEPGKQPEDPEFEKKHPRDGSGKFAKKKEIGEKEDEKGEGDDEGELDEEPWPGADPEKGIKGVVTLDGVQYTIQDGVSKEEVLKFHEVNQNTLAHARELGYDLASTPVTILASSEYLAAAVPVFDTGAHGITIDAGLVDHPDLLEAHVFHETLHTQPRTIDSGRGMDSARYRWPALDYEEISTTIKTMEYCERRGIPVVADYGPWLSPVFQAADNLGMSKDQLYGFVSAVHKLDGTAAGPVYEYFFRRGEAQKKFNRDVLDKWLPSRADVWEEIYSVYDEEWKDWGEISW
jgi:hypothetical protein